MSTTVIESPATIAHPRAGKPALFQVWIDLEFGAPPADWWWNSPPKPLADAIAESIEARRGGWVTQVLPEGVNPRPDGRWDNP